MLNISGAGGRTPGPEFTIGGSVNAALLSFTKAMADVGIRDGVQVNAINPGTIRTGRLQMRLASIVKEQQIDLETAERRFVQESQVTRIGEPEDVANLVAFVVGPEGRFLQGSLIDSTAVPPKQFNAGTEGTVPSVPAFYFLPMLALLASAIVASASGFRIKPAFRFFSVASFTALTYTSCLGYSLVEFRIAERFVGAQQHAELTCGCAGGLSVVAAIDRCWYGML